MKLLEKNQRKRKKDNSNIFDCPTEDDVRERFDEAHDAYEGPHMEFADDGSTVLQFERLPKKKRKIAQSIGLDLQTYKNEVKDWFQSIEELPFVDGIKKYSKYDCDKKDVTRLFYATLHLVNDGVLEIMTLTTEVAPENFLLRKL